MQSSIAIVTENAADYAQPHDETNRRWLWFPGSLLGFFLICWIGSLLYGLLKAKRQRKREKEEENIRNKVMPAIYPARYLTGMGTEGPNTARFYWQQRWEE